MDGEPIACGQDYSIKAAEQLASEKAYMILSSKDGEKMAI
ncbi:MAG: hypothetical protein ACOYLE_09645 [Bacteroidales bacterium]